MSFDECITAGTKPIGPPANSWVLKVLCLKKEKDLNQGLIHSNEIISLNQGTGLSDVTKGDLKTKMMGILMHNCKADS